MITYLERITASLERIAASLECLTELSNVPIVAQNVVQSHYTLHSWLDEWLNTYKAPTVSANTFAVLEKDIRVYIKPSLPNIPLASIDGITVQRFITGPKLAEKSRTRKSVFDTLNQSFKTAFSLYLVSDNPMRGVTIPVHKRRRGSALSSGEQEEFLQNIKGHIAEEYFKFLLYTGCRRCEGLAITLSDFNLQADDCRGNITIRGTKTEAAERVIPLFKNVHASWSKYIVTKQGKPLFPFKPHTVTRWFKKLCPNHKLHDLRHTFATNCIAAGVDKKVLQEWLGHSDFETTMDTYAHVSEQLNVKEAERLNVFLNTPLGNKKTV